jgi:hypothetical protein
MNTSNRFQGPGTTTEREKWQAANKRHGAETSGSKSKKGFWKKYTDRLKNTRCTRTSQDCE